MDSTLELREEISGDECALDEKDALVTHARLLSEKRISLLILASGLVLYMAGLLVGTWKNFVGMVVFSAGMLALGLGAAALWIKVDTKRASWQTRQAARSEDAEISDQ